MFQSKVRFQALFSFSVAHSQNQSTDEAYYFKRALKYGFLELFTKYFFQPSIQEILPCCRYLTCSPARARQNCGRGFLIKCLKTIFFDTQSWQVMRFSHIDSVRNVKFGSEISMKTFFSTKIFYVHYMFCIIQRLWKTSKVLFQSVIRTSKESRWSENSSKISEKCQIWVRNFDENFFFHQNFF